MGSGRYWGHCWCNRLRLGNLEDRSLGGWRCSPVVVMDWRALRMMSRLSISLAQHWEEKLIRRIENHLKALVY